MNGWLGLGSVTLAYTGGASSESKGFKYRCFFSSDNPLLQLSNTDARCIKVQHHRCDLEEALTKDPSVQTLHTQYAHLTIRAIRCQSKRLFAHVHFLASDMDVDAWWVVAPERALILTTF